jgi:TonB-dependent starch-binding outer membrane protein SusC
MKKVYRSSTKTASVILLLLACLSAYAQERVLTGRVVDATGTAMPGVNIIKKGTATGTATDANGDFSLSVSDDDILQVSFIGYKTQEIPVGNQTRLEVKIEEDYETLDEVVVVGYGEMRRADLASAQTSVSSKDISRTLNTTLDQAIQGRAAGVYVTQNTGAPGGGISVNIRGVNSLSGTNEPLYVIDGIQIQPSASPGGTNPLSSLNPTDIESMEILQGPNATAVYGSRATNGVIIVTTKRGKAGEMKINYDFTYSLQTAPKKLEIMNMREYAQMENEYKAIAGGAVREDFLDPSILGEGTDWQDELFLSAAMQKHQVSLSGGNEKATFYLSGERLTQEGIALGSGYERSSIRLNVDLKPRKWLAIGANLNPVQSDYKVATTNSNVIVNAIQLGPHIPVKNLDGTYGGGNISNSSAEQFAPPNPIGLANLTTNERTERRIWGGLTALIKFLENFEVRSNFNVDVGFNNSTYYLPTYKFGYQENTVARLQNYHNFSAGWLWNQTLNYSKQFGKHSVSAMVTHEAYAGFWKNLMAERRGFSTNEILDIEAGDESLQDTGGGQAEWAQDSYLGRLHYNYGDRYIVTGAIRADGSINFGPGNKWGYFPSLAAVWRVSEESFFDGVSFINDLRFRFETGTTGNQSGNSRAIYGTLRAGPSTWGTSFIPDRFPNPDFQWEETKTNNFGFNLGLFDNKIQFEADYFIKNTDNLIFPANLPWYMGTASNGAPGAPIVNIGALSNEGWSFSLNTVNFNRNGLKWTSNFNMTHVQTKVKTLAGGQGQVDKINWWMKNWTQRSAIGQAPWLFWGYMEDGLFDNLEELETSALPADNNGVEYPIAENSIWVGDVKYKDLNGDGIITGEDQTFIGNPYPKFNGGFTNEFTYKGFELSILMTFTYGNDVYNFIRSENTNPNNINLGRNMFSEAFNYAKIGTDAEGNAILENPGTRIPRMSGGNKNNNFDRHTDKWVEDGSYVRLKNISLFYTIPSNIVDKAKVLERVRVGVSAQNLFTITDYSGYDPEIGAYVGPNADTYNAAVGVDYGRYPITPVYSFNVGIEF